MTTTHQEMLTSRERVVRTLNRQPVDRYPIDLGSHFSTGISAFAYWRLREHLGLSTADIWAPDVVQMLAHVDDGTVCKLPGDPASAEIGMNGNVGDEVTAGFSLAYRDEREVPDDTVILFPQIAMKGELRSFGGGPVYQVSSQAA